MTPKIIFKNKSVVTVSFDICVSDLATLLKARSDKLEGRGQRGRPRSLSSDQIAEILAMKARGVKQKDIAAHFGLSPYTISRVCTHTYLPESIIIESEEF